MTIMLRHSNEQGNEVCTFIREIQRYTTVQKLDEMVLKHLINWILVGKVKKVDGPKT